MANYGDDRDRHIRIEDVTVTPPPSISVKDWEELCSLMRRVGFSYEATVVEAADGSHIPKKAVP